MNTLITFKFCSNCGILCNLLKIDQNINVAILHLRGYNFKRTIGIMSYIIQWNLLYITLESVL